MNKQDIQSLLHSTYQHLADYVVSVDDHLWAQGPSGKWKAGQHIVHLSQSTAAINKALSMPKFLLRYKFGKANRPSRSYEEVIQRYQEKLAAADPSKTSPFSRNMPATDHTTKTKDLLELKLHTERLVKLVGRLSDKQLDKLLLPHPLMGRMTLREITMWNAYHAEHHEQVLRDKY